MEYSLVEITVWEQTKNIQDPQTALRNAGIFHGYLSSKEKGEEESEFKNLQFTFKTSLSSPSSCLAGVKHLFPAKIFIEPLLYAYLLGSWSSLQTLAPLTMQIKTVKRSQENNAKSHRDQALDFSSVHRHFVALSLLFFFSCFIFFCLAVTTFPHIICFTYLSCLFSVCHARR